MPEGGFVMLKSVTRIGIHYDVIVIMTLSILYKEREVK